MTAPSPRISPAPASSNSDLPFWSPAALAALQNLTSARIFPPATILIEQASAVGGVYLIEHGIVKLLRCEVVADREVVVALRYSGWPLGAAAVILNNPSPVTAETLTSCRVRELSRDRFLEAMKTNPAFSWQIHLLHSRWLHEQFGQLASFKALSARCRLERLLHELCRIQSISRLDKPIRLRVPMKHLQLAEALMVTPQHLSRLLAELERAGLIRREKRWLLIPEPQKLSASQLSTHHQVGTVPARRRLY